jgi:hypothetical protein
MTAPSASATAEVSPANGLPPEEIIRRIEKALARDKTHDWPTMLSMILAGKAQIFANAHGAWITEVVQTPLARWLNVWVVAGELPGVMELQDQVLDFARKQGCQHVVATARFGWKNVAREHGWREHAMVITHEL